MRSARRAAKACSADERTAIRGRRGLGCAAAGRRGLRTLARERDRAEILRRVRTVRPEHARRWGRMTAHQMVCHLADGFRMMAGRKPVPGTPGLLERTLVKWIALYAPVRWRPGFVTAPELDQTLQGTRPAGFAEDVAQLEELIHLVTTQPSDIGRPPHPVFGPMSERAWLRWGYLHADHHLRQLGA